MSVVSPRAVVAAPNKGMPLTAVTASKMIAAFRPKYLAMAGICAGIAGRVRLGDAIFADPSWDWGSGKIVESASKQQLQSAPYQHRLDESLRLKAHDFRRDVGLLAQIRAKWQGPKPDTEIAVHVGAVASGATVLQSARKMKELIDSHKDLRGIEMEIYAALCAAEYAANPKPSPFAVKSVCDFGDKNKSDSFQDYAAFVSANVLFEFALGYL
ncbi:phosphorylase family protein [Bradyrhizobium sp. CCBAU 65884]|uniref:phosphorylase family protein n=1 Tax=Bradyrhizobium sp. CCBAU 65884 TaxID=722477 RepID=UPI0023064625|nr:hypothetical protein [Bradyrhizobium sp. CCBAU 65884]